MENHTVNKLTNRINELNSAILNIKGDKVHILGFMSKEMMEKYFEGSKNWYVIGLYDKEEMSFFDTKDNAFFIVQKEGEEIARYQYKPIDKQTVKLKVKSEKGNNLYRTFIVRKDVFSNSYHFNLIKKDIENDSILFENKKSLNEYLKNEFNSKLQE